MKRLPNSRKDGPVTRKIKVVLVGLMLGIVVGAVARDYYVESYTRRTVFVQAEAEAEHMMRAMVNEVRSYNEETGEVPETLTATGVAENELLGRYYRVRDSLETASDGRFVIYADPDGENPPRYRLVPCRLEFALEGGEGEFVWDEP